MAIFKEGDPVKLSPMVLEDQSLKSNHHLLERIMKEERGGIIKTQDKVKSKPEMYYYWVKFHYATFLLNEHHIIPA